MIVTTVPEIPKEHFLVDMRLFERQLENAGEMGLVSVQDVLRLLQGYKQKGASSYE